MDRRSCPAGESPLSGSAMLVRNGSFGEAELTPKKGAIGMVTLYPVSKSSGTWRLRGLVPQQLQYFGKVY
jgi:hypothetical protein